MDNKPTGTGVPKVGPGERHMSVPGLVSGQIALNESENAVG